MFCKNCGQQIADQAVFCVHCGAATDAASALNVQQAVPAKRTNGFAIAGFVLTLIGLFCGYYTYDIVPLLGLIFSIVGLVKSKEYGSGRGLSIAGIVISLASIVLCIVLIIVVLPAILAALGGLAGSVNGF